jgi:hypothetical protein
MDGFRGSERERQSETESGPARVTKPFARARFVAGAESGEGYGLCASEKAPRLRGLIGMAPHGSSGTPKLYPLPNRASDSLSAFGSPTRVKGRSGMRARNQVTRGKPVTGTGATCGYKHLFPSHLGDN